VVTGGARRLFFDTSTGPLLEINGPMGLNDASNPSGRILEAAGFDIGAPNNVLRAHLLFVVDNTMRFRSVRLAKI